LGITKEFSEKKMIKARPAVRLFIEYYAVYASLLFGSDKQSAMGRSALLSLESENMSNVEDAKDFKDLREALRLLYDNPDSKVDRTRPLMILSRIVSKAKITDNDLTDAGAGKLVTLAQKMRELFEK
jgi:hypothetical protein